MNARRAAVVASLIPVVAWWLVVAPTTAPRVVPQASPPVAKRSRDVGQERLRELDLTIAAFPWLVAHRTFVRCMTASGTACEYFDRDGEELITLRDFAGVQNHASRMHDWWMNLPAVERNRIAETIARVEGR